MARNYELPVALQKPAVLQLAAHCDKTAAAEEAEAERLASRSIRRKFDPNTGTVVVQLPRLRARARRENSMYASGGRRRRLQHRRTVAAILIQKLIGMVTPESRRTPHLESAERRLKTVSGLGPHRRRHRAAGVRVS